MNKLNWGCGSIQPEGWINVDKDPEFKATRGVSHMANDSFDVIVAHCSLQMVDWHDLVYVLSELRRILKPGGVLRISLPDIETGFRHYIDGDKQWFPNGEDDIDERFSAWLTWYSTTKTLLTKKAVLNKLKEASFYSAYPAEFKMTASEFIEITNLDEREHECYFVEAAK